jgi:hypothetical protein
MPLAKAPSKIAFPATAEERYYFPSSFGISSSTPTRYTINYHPFVIKKNTQSLKLCYEQVAGGSQTIIAGIYDGSNGFASAPLLLSATINITGIGIFTSASTLFFRSGSYVIVAGIATSATPISSRSFTSNSLMLESLGRASTDTTISTGNFYTQTGLTDLPASIGTITYSSTNVGANVFLRY